MAAFEAAIGVGADGVELDVRATRDGAVVVFHDHDLRRLAGDARALDALLRRELPAVGGAPIPTLDDALDLLLGAGLRVNVEVKAGAAACAGVLARRRPAERERVVVSSFDPAALTAVREALPSVACALLFDREAALAPSAFADVAGVHPHHEAVDAPSVARWHARGWFVNVWTVNDPARARDLARMGVDGLVTDDVPAARRACESSG